MLHQPLEGGWGWACVFGCAIVNFICVGVLQSFGIILVAIMEEFNCPSATAAWIGATTGSLQMILAPVAGILLQRFSCRWVTFAGALVSAAGCLMSFFSRSWVTLFFTFGAVTGFGNALVYTPSLVILSHYFDKRKALANGFAICGVGIGTIVLPPLIQFLMTEVKFSFAMLYVGSIQLQMCICAILYRPIGDNYKIDIKEELALTKYFLPIGQQFSKKLNSTKDVESKNRKVDRSFADRILIFFKSIDLGILKDRKFFPFVIVYASLIISVYCVMCYIVSLALEKGISKQNAAFLISLSGVMDIFGRAGYGIILNFTFASQRTLKIFIFTCIMFSVINLMAPLLCASFLSFAIVAGTIGFISGGDMTAILLIAQELFGRENYARVLPYSLFCLGIVCTIVLPFAGWLVDIYGSFTIVFYFAASINLLGCLAGLYIQYKLL